MSPHDDQSRRSAAFGPRSACSANSTVGGFFATSNFAASGCFAASATSAGISSSAGEENVTVPLTAPLSCGGQSAFAEVQKHARPNAATEQRIDFMRILNEWLNVTSVSPAAGLRHFIFRRHERALV